MSFQDFVGHFLSLFTYCHCSCLPSIAMNSYIMNAGSPKSPSILALTRGTTRNESWFHKWKLGWASECAYFAKPVSIPIWHYCNTIGPTLPSSFVASASSSPVFLSNHPDSVKAADSDKMHCEWCCRCSRYFVG